MRNVAKSHPPRVGRRHGVAVSIRANHAIRDPYAEIQIFKNEEEFIAECDAVDAARHRRDCRSARDAVPSPEGSGAQARENRAPAVHTATHPFLEERE